jgi:ArsR family transcriptional regulator
MKTSSLDALEQMFKALADDTRLRILALLAAGEVCVCHIHGALDVPQPTVSRHLAYLRKAGLVGARRDGLWMHYSLELPDAPAAARVLKASLEAVHATAGTTTDRRRLSGLVSIPLKTLNTAAENCCKP